MKKEKSTSIQEIIRALLDEKVPFPPTYLHGFSSLSPQNISELSKAWLQVNPDRRANLFEDLENISDSDTLVDFDALCIFALDDPDPRVRARSISMLWENGKPALAKKFMTMAQNDSDEVVRSSSAAALGMYVYMGELEEISEMISNAVVDKLLDIYKSDDKPIVRRRCLEALGFSSRDEVKDMIEKAYHSKEAEWVASSLFAMGRSADQHWEKSVLKKLGSDDKEIRFEAVRAAGELAISNARKPLMELLEDSENLDPDLRDAAIWSLSQIGGDGVRGLLEELLEATDDEEDSEYLDAALDNLNFTEGFTDFDMIDLENDDLDEDRFSNARKN